MEARLLSDAVSAALEHAPKLVNAPSTVLGTVTAYDAASSLASVQVDGDATSIQALNAGGASIYVGQRVLLLFAPPAVYVIGGVGQGNVPHARAVRNVFANNNDFTNQTTYADFPNATDAAAMQISFTKYRSDTKLICSVSGECELTSGVAQGLVIGLSIGGVDYNVARGWFLTAVYRFWIIGHAEVTGVPAGVHTVKPRFAADTASAVTFAAVADILSYSITETL